MALRGLIEEWYRGPVFLFGHSMGGLISAHLLLESRAAFRGRCCPGRLSMLSIQRRHRYLVGRLLKRLYPSWGWCLSMRMGEP